MPDFDLDAALGPYRCPLADLVNLATGRATDESQSRTGEVFFYDAGASDWRPVSEFPKCRIFVYCDVSDNQPADAAALSRLLKNEKFPIGAGGFDCTNFQPWVQSGWPDELREWEQRARSFIESLWPRRKPPHGEGSPETKGEDQADRPHPWTADIKRTFLDGHSDTAKIIHLPVNGLAAYLHLYFRDAVAPHAICLPWADEGHEHRSETWGRVLQMDHAAHESLLVLPAQVEPTTAYASDWHSMSRTFPEWRRIAYSAKPARICHLV